MNRDPFQSFIDLIQFDQDIYSLKQQIAQTQDTLDKIAQEKLLLDRKREQVQQELHQAKKIVDVYELEMKTLEDQEQLKKQQLDTLKNPKDYFVLTADLETIKKKQHDLEGQIVESWHKLDQAKRALDQAAKDAEEKMRRLNGSEHEQQELLAQHTERFKRIENSRPEKLISIPDEWLEKYSVMRERISDPVVPVENDSCSACFQTIILSDLQRLRKRALLQCRNCFRFLYIPGTVEIEQGI